MNDLNDEDHDRFPRHERAGWYLLSNSNTLGAASENPVTPEPAAHSAGIAASCPSKSFHFGRGTAGPKHESWRAPPGSPVDTLASDRRVGSRICRNSPIPPRITPFGTV